MHRLVLHTIQLGRWIIQLFFYFQLVRFTPPRELTPPPIHQEDFKSFQSITFASGPSTPGPISPSQSQPGWSAAMEEPRPRPNQSNFNRPSSNKNSSFGGGGFQARGRTSTNIRPTAMQRVQHPPTISQTAVQNGTQPPETTMRSSAVLVLRPSWETKCLSLLQIISNQFGCPCQLSD